MIPFYKAQSLGNIFNVVGLDQLPVWMQTQLKEGFQKNSYEDLSFFNDIAQDMCSAKRGSLCDQLLVVWQEDEYPPQNPPSDIMSQISDFTNVSVLFFNADGSMAESCGNGSRALANMIMQEEQVNSVCIHTVAGLVWASHTEKEFALREDALAQEREVEVFFPIRSIEPFRLKKLELAKSKEFSTSKKTAYVVDMGNPHLVIIHEPGVVGLWIEIREELAIEAEKFGLQIEIDQRFVNRTNVGFASSLTDEQLALVVHERGAGITQACGTGALAAAVAKWTQDNNNNDIRTKTHKPITVCQAGGNVVVSHYKNWVGQLGQTSVVFKGELLAISGLH